MMNDESQFKRINEVLREAWDTGGGQALRCLMWSLHNDAVRVPLFTALTDIDEGLRTEFCALICLPFDVRGKMVEALLIQSGEWGRVRLPSDVCDGEPLKWAVYGEEVAA